MTSFYVPATNTFVDDFHATTKKDVANFMGLANGTWIAICNEQKCRYATCDTADEDSNFYMCNVKIGCSVRFD